MVCSLFPPTPEPPISSLRRSAQSLPSVVPSPSSDARLKSGSPRPRPTPHADAEARRRHKTVRAAGVTKVVERRPVVRASRVAVARSLQWVLRCIRDAETNGPMNGRWDYRAVNPAGFYGAYQFSPGTWSGYAANGWEDVRPDRAPAWVQDAAAAALYRARRLQPWGYRARVNCG